MGFLVIVRYGKYMYIIGLDKHKFSAYNCKYFLTHYFLTYVLGAQKNRLNETVLLSTTASLRRFF